MTYIFLHIYIQTVPLGYLIVNLVKFASCSCVHSFVHGCLKVGNGNIKFEMGMCRFGMEPYSRRGSAAWLLVAVCARLFWLVKFALLLSRWSAPRRKFSLASGAVDISTG